MIHGDMADIAAEYEQRDRDMALARRRAAPMEEPDEDSNGNRYCLDCAGRREKMQRVHGAAGKPVLEDTE
jgi:hypothetical protein